MPEPSLASEEMETLSPGALAWKPTSLDPEEPPVLEPDAAAAAAASVEPEAEGPAELELDELVPLTMTGTKNLVSIPLL